MRNIEALKNYFLGKDPQLKETMADNSLRLIGIPGREFVLRAEVLQRLKKLRDELTEKDEEQQEQIDDLIEDVEALTTWKTNNDFVFVQDLNIALSRYYTKEQVDEIVSIIPRFDIEIVETLPLEDISETTIYLVPNGSQPLSGDYYDEYIYVNDQWEHIGSTAVDLSNYYTKTETNVLLSGKQGTLTPGTGIDITNNVISATGGSGTPTLDADLDVSNNFFILDEGIYYSGNHIVKYYDSQLADNVTVVPQNALFFYSAAYNTFEILNLTEWGIPDLISYKYVWENNAWKAHIVGTTTTIDSNSTDGEIPTAKAVYDALPNITSGTTDLVAGSSPLAEGALYFVYE